MAKPSDRRAKKKVARADSEPEQALLDALVATAEDGVIAVDASGAVRAVNPVALRIFGWSQAPARVVPWPEAIPWLRADRSGSLAPDEAPLARALRGDSGRGELFAVERSPGQRILVRAAYGPLRGKGRRPAGALLLVRDVSEEQQLRGRLEQHQAQLDLRASIMADVTSRASTADLIGRTLDRLHERFADLRVCYSLVDENMHIRVLDVRQPPAMPVILGARADLNLVPAYLYALLGHGFFCCSDTELETALEPLQQRLLDAGIRALVNAPVRHAEALRGILSFHCSDARSWSEHEIGTLRMVADYLSLAMLDEHREEERRAAQTELAWSVLHDRLTGLANRVLFTDRLEQAIRRAQRDSRRAYAVLFLDFDHFKIVNDSLGHEVGDQLLIEIANRLKANLREGDTSSRWSRFCLPARLGGDEFVLLLEDISGMPEVESIVQRIHQVLAAPHRVGTYEFTATASIGIVVDDGGRYQRAEHVLRDADTAMYRAKQQGKARHVVFDEEMHNAAVRRLTMERELRLAVERAEFVAHYQPIVELRTGRIVGFESLLRWRHPERGLVPPAEFIPLSEEIGLVIPIGEWILTHSAHQLRVWQERFPSLGGLTVSVNVSKRQVQPGFVASIERVLRETGLAARSLKLEITESVVMENPGDAAPMLREIEQLGIQLCMDDFGTGHSSLGTLQRYPIHVLKVDRSFIAALDDRAEYAAITQAIVTLAHSLHMKVVAEGVEKREHVEILRELDCDEAQGFFFARPMAVEEATETLERAVRGATWK